MTTAESTLSKRADRQTPSAYPLQSISVREALQKVHGKGDLIQTLAYICLPTQVVPATALVQSNGHLAYRGHKRVIQHDPLLELLELARDGHNDGDTYVDLTADPLDWLRIRRSGAQLHVYGAKELLGLPSTWASPLLSSRAVIDALQATLELEEDPLTDSVVDTCDGIVVVEADESVLMLEPLESPLQEDAPAPTQLPRQWRRGALANSIAVMLGGELQGIRDGTHPQLATAEVHIPGWRVLVSLRCTDDGESLAGVSGGFDDDATCAGVTIPEGFTPLGREGDVVIARHERTTCRVLLLPAG